MWFAKVAKDPVAKLWEEKGSKNHQTTCLWLFTFHVNPITRVDYLPNQNRSNPPTGEATMSRFVGITGLHSDAAPPEASEGKQ